MTSLQLNTQDVATYIGIDISKHSLDVYVHPAGQSKGFTNDMAGFRILNKWLCCLPGAFVVFEATGRYHRDLQVFLQARGYPLAVLNPCRARRFAQAMGMLAKTDKADAKMLALYATMMQPDITPLPDKTLDMLKTLIVARRALIKRMTQITNCKQDCRGTLLRRQNKQAIKQCRRHLLQIDQEMTAVRAKSPSLQHRFDILTSIPGIGPLTAMTLIAEMPELGSMTAKEAASLTGLAPIAQDSGIYRGKRKIKAGRHGPRLALYMAAVASLRFNDDMQKFYSGLTQNGKPPKVALVAVMRKLIILANTLITQQRKWIKKAP